MITGPTSARPRKRDASFLQMAIVAAVGGMLAIGFSIGFPIWAKLHGQPYTPAFSLFAAWGLAALGGAFACWRTYLITDGSPRRPPPGGVRLDFVRRTDATARCGDGAATDDRRAA